MSFPLICLFFYFKIAQKICAYKSEDYACCGDENIRQPVRMEYRKDHNRGGDHYTDNCMKRFGIMLFEYVLDNPCKRRSSQNHTHYPGNDYYRLKARKTCVKRFVDTQAHHNRGTRKARNNDA